MSLLFLSLWFPGLASLAAGRRGASARNLFVGVQSFTALKPPLLCVCLFHWTSSHFRLEVYLMCFPGLRLLQNNCYSAWVLRKMRLKWWCCWLWAPCDTHPQQVALWAGSAQFSEVCTLLHIVVRRCKIVCTKYELVLLLIGFEFHIVLCCLLGLY